MLVRKEVSFENEKVKIKIRPTNRLGVENIM
jgi:hypothetical protein